MGRTGSEYVTKPQAAKMLNVTVRTLDKWVQQRLLHPHVLDQKARQGNRPHYFLRSDIRALMHARACKTADTWQIYGLALQALSTARQTDRRLTALFEHLGLNITPLDRDPDSVRALYESARRGFVTADLTNADWFTFWGGAFFSIDEIYLELVQQATADNEPWKVFLDFANSVTRELCRVGVEAPFKQPVLRFETGKRNLLYVSFMFCQRLYGIEAARFLFANRPSAVDELMAILH